jgi:hypothetical protein
MERSKGQNGPSLVLIGAKSFLGEESSAAEWTGKKTEGL